MDLKPLCVALLLAVVGTTGLAQSPAAGRVAIGLEVFPRLLALDTEIEQKRSPDGTLLVVLVRGNDPADANRSAELLRSRVSMIHGARAVFRVSPVPDLVTAAAPPAAILIAAPIPAGDRDRLTVYAIQQGRIVFSPFEGDVERGVTAGIFIGARVQLFFNARTLEASRIQLAPGVLRLAKVYD